LYFTNAGIFVSEGQAVLIDPGIFADEINAIVQFTREQAFAPQAIILTHSHWDHIFGPEYFPNINIIAHANYAQETSGEKGKRALQQIAQWEAQYHIDRDCPFVIPQPHQTVETSMQLTIGSLELVLLHAPGHASDQLVMYHADSATLWAGDMLSDLEIPFISHSLAAYKQTLARLAALDIRALVPGHGNPTTDPADIRARLADDAAYLAELEEKISRAVAQGKTLPETIDLCGAMRYRRTAENSSPHRMNVASCYIELGGPADPTQVGWSQET
jgi:glyoxylase-like metal-dependent hydrolase (beta-lactamase superfamily II)